MSSMPFPSGTWNFEVVPMAGGPAKQVVTTWGTMTFQTTAKQPQLVLQVGLSTSEPVNVTWSSVSSDAGSITSNPSFNVGDHTYLFSAITVFLLPVSAADHRIAFSVHVTVDQAPSLFVALPNTSAILAPKPAEYEVFGANMTAPFCTLNAAAGGDVQVIASTGYTLEGKRHWNNPTKSWPPAISWNLKDTSGISYSFNGALTTSPDPFLQRVTWSFSGTFAKGGLEGDDDWTSTSHTDPFAVRVAKKSYA